jgi:chromatin remodeling complex protein RSC6
MSKKNSKIETPVEDSNVVVDVNPVTEQFGGILNTLSSFRSSITMLQNQVRALEKNVNKQMRQFARESKRNKNKGNRKPSGFAVPTKISKDLCKFMGKKEGAEVARTEVTQYIIKYIKDGDLQWKENRKIIKPDQKLKKLLGVNKNEEVNYFNLQKYMNKHFIKKSDKKSGDDSSH